MFKELDFVDVVAVVFGLIILGATIVAYFQGMELDPDFKSWFYSVLLFFIGKKLPQNLGK